MKTTGSLIGISWALVRRSFLSCSELIKLFGQSSGNIAIVLAAYEERRAYCEILEAELPVDASDAFHNAGQVMELFSQVSRAKIERR